MAAYLKEVNGELVLVDPVGAAVSETIERLNLYHRDDAAMTRLMNRAREKGDDFVVVLFDADDPLFEGAVEALMPGHDWNQYRARGELPVARGVVPRKLVTNIQSVLKKAKVLLLPPIPKGFFVAIYGAGGVTFVSWEPPGEMSV